MRHRLLFACTAVAALAALALSPWLAWREAERHAYAAQASLATRFAQDVLHRSDEMVRQSLAGVALLARSPDGPCTPGQRAIMRRIDLTSTYIQAIGQVRDGVVRCSSMGDTPIPLGSRILRTSDGLRIYSSVPLDGNDGSPLMAIERDGYAALIHTDLPLDAGSAIPGMSLAALHLERRLDEPVTMAAGYIDRAWVKRLGSRRSVTFTDGRYLVAVVRSRVLPTAGVAALPLSELPALRNAVALRLVPAGVVAGVAIAAALLLLARRQTSLTTALRRGLRNHEFFMLYQPVVDLQSGRCTGAEALLRWRRDTGELVGPDVFIPLAEQTGTIGALTARVLELVERDTGDFLAAHPGFHLAVNVSAADLAADPIVGLFDAMLARGAITATNLVVEITERGILDIEAARTVIGALRARGIHVAIDDFGTGYAGLSYLESLQVDALKIDRSFIEAIGTTAPTNQVVSHIIAMAGAMRLAMIAEGVETPAQADYLRARGVQYAQGWLYGRPQPFEDVAALFERGAGSAARSPGAATGS
ncbi:EAL domain-containing protein [Pseudoduganella umbonata]|uniref:cyclic-guanylate-specific phosphodiesterase n=1 Tax=Pseudoduganella umbonata TaxID=864828 RepID=A0A4P8HPA5_9BURK|nr:EAL domain-containing protein [Pseudoduganella umbonata]MBB3221098.1 sensor c-di-GMP phosphodiesterase-like protein [Pseudoduganella umbonata]QCP10294.1 EAL domain-containing protein [Pseudoduganella umbonata]